MLDFSVNYEYRKKLERMLRTFTPEQKDLFEDWFELASVAISSMAMEYKVAGYKEGIATAKNYRKYKTKKSNSANWRENMNYKLLKIYTTASTRRWRSQHRRRKSRNAIRHSLKCWKSRNGGWCCRSSTPKTALWRTHPSTALSLDLSWRGGSLWN